MKFLQIVLLMLLGNLALPIHAQGLSVGDKDFDCILDMQPVRGFYVDNLIPGQLDATLAVANAGRGKYPPGSVVQLVPGEVMVKHPSGFSTDTKDWEFFELEVSTEGSRIGKRGFADVVNRFGGNCLGCHAKAKPEFDLICEKGHGCAPIPLTDQVITLLQKTDARCGGRYTPTPQELEVLKQLAKQLGG